MRLQIFITKIGITLWLIFHSLISLAQQSGSKQLVIAGKQYERSGVHNFLWGKHYRKEWATPVKVPVLYLDTTFGGLTPYAIGGGRQSKSLRLKNSDGNEYVLRSVTKYYTKTLPEIYRNTFIESIVNDQASLTHPYAAPTISPMASAAGIYHTDPRIVYVPQQKELGKYNEVYADALYTLEKRPDGNWEGTDEFGNSEKIIGTDKLLEKLQKDNDNRVDQPAFAKARLFDMFIGDWGRHEDQWRWAKIEEGKKNIYRPVPRDRDQAYTKFDGLFTKMALSAADLDHLQSFDYKIKDVREYSFTARNLDRHFENELTLKQWQEAAEEIQKALTDEVIENAVMKLPPEVYPISGCEITTKLKSRRDKLKDYATEYYKFLAKEVEIVGTKGAEYFEIKRLHDSKTSVAVYNITKKGEVEKLPYYARIFNNDETKEVRIYGISGEDKYRVTGDANSGIRIRIIGGDEKDEITDSPSVAYAGPKLKIYDDANNIFHTTSGSQLYLSNDSNLHKYKYDSYSYDKKGLKLSLFYNNPDRFYIRIGYKWRKYQWRKEPFGYEHGVYVAYSLSQNAFSFLYEGAVNQLVGKWDLRMRVFQDMIRWRYFYGAGNETPNIYTKNYYQVRTTELNTSVGLFRKLNDFHSLGFYSVFQTVKVINDRGRFVTDVMPSSALNYFEPYYFTGLQADYVFQHVDNRIIPQKGIYFNANAGYVLDILFPSRSYANFTGTLKLFVPLIDKFSLAIFTGSSTVTGNPEFFQLPAIGGSLTLRGYHRDRFHGQTTFYNSNELRWITNMRTRVTNGKIGLLTFVDDGRVWLPAEVSSKLHIGYGGGFLIAPFNKFMASLTYGLSEDGALFQIRFNKPL